MQTKSISVTLPVEHAFERMKRVLFQPFDLGKWFTIGFCAWLAYLGEGGGGGGGGGNGFHGGPGRGGGPDFRHIFITVRDYVVANLWWLLPVIAGALLVCFALGALILWLSSRGKFMFLDNVAKNRGAVREPWGSCRQEANSLFVFRLILGIITVLPFLLLLALAVLFIWQQVMAQAVLGGPMLGLVGSVLSMILFGVVVWVINRFTTDFVVPLQYLRKSRVLDAWRDFLPMLAQSAGYFALYLLFRILLAIAIGAIILVLVLITCCVAGCLMAIPYIGTVLILPILVFERSYSLYFLAQFGQQFDVFSYVDEP